ncbi:MAG: hypothetical protein IKE43_05445 [Coriobacteriales bacterium]|nr:hypothetical protein [Coriobacteriales bacterium]
MEIRAGRHQGVVKVVCILFFVLFAMAMAATPAFAASKGAVGTNLGGIDVRAQFLGATQDVSYESQDYLSTKAGHIEISLPLTMGEVLAGSSGGNEFFFRGATGVVLIQDMLAPVAANERENYLLGIQKDIITSKDLLDVWDAEAPYLRTMDGVTLGDFRIWGYMAGEPMQGACVFAFFNDTTYYILLMFEDYANTSNLVSRTVNVIAQSIRGTESGKDIAYVTKATQEASPTYATYEAYSEPELVFNENYYETGDGIVSIGLPGTYELTAWEGAESLAWWGLSTTPYGAFYSTDPYYTEHLGSYGQAVYIEEGEWLICEYCYWTKIA